MPVPGPRGESIWLAVEAPGLSAESVRAHLAERLDPLSLPRRLRVVERLPRGPAGKVARSALLELFGEPLAGGVVGVERIDGTRAVAEARLEAGHPCLEGHFPGRPIAPAVALLSLLVLAPAEATWPDLVGVERLIRAKFTRPVEPGVSLRVELERSAPRATPATLRFRIASADGEHASGRFELFERQETP